MEENQNPQSDMRVLENEIKHISEGMKRLEDMLRDQTSRNQREWDSLHKEIENNNKINRREMDDLKEKTGKEIGELRLEFTNFRTKVLAYATAGSAIGGLIFQLISK